MQTSTWVGLFLMVGTNIACADPGCLEFNNRWNALTKPDKATQFFCVEPLEPFDHDANDFSPVNAYWLSEVSRIIYKEERKKEPKRNDYLEPVGLNETDFFDEKGIQCALIESKDPTKQFSILVFRGTNNVTDWFENLNVDLINFSNQARVHQGFYDALMKVWPRLEPKLAKLQGPIYYCGHSLGGALAIIAAAKSERKPQSVYTYGCPRVGDAEFSTSLESIAIYRIVNHLDMVTTIPPTVKYLEYAHPGRTCYITHDNRLLINPNVKTILQDRSVKPRTKNKKVDRRGFFDPPEPMADHAPVNYSAHLERILVNDNEVTK
jgi:triacylglycerol lipase